MLGAARIGATSAADLANQLDFEGAAPESAVLLGSQTHGVQTPLRIVHHS